MLLLFRANIGYTNAPQYYVIRKLPVLFYFHLMSQKNYPPPPLKNYVYAPHVPSVIWHHRQNCDQIFPKFGLGVLYKKLSRKQSDVQPSLRRPGRVITTSAPNRNYGLKKITIFLISVFVSQKCRNCCTQTFKFM